MKTLVFNLLLLGLSSFWMGCECDQAGGKVQGKQCKNDSGEQFLTSTGSGAQDGPIQIEGYHISELDNKAISTPFELAWDAIDGAAYYMIRLHTRGEDCSVASSLYEVRVDAPATSFLVDPQVPDGEYLLCVVAYDSGDQLLEPIQSAHIVIDNTGPHGIAGHWFFADEVAKVELRFQLPANVSDFSEVVLLRSAPLGAMPACSDADLVRASWSEFQNAGVLSFQDSVEAAQAGYALNYKLCAYDALGNRSEFTLANVRTTLMVHEIFFTDTLYSGNLGGMQGADALCNSAGGGSNWKAIISDNATSVVDHISMRGPVRNKQGSIFARSPAQLLGDLGVSVGYNEAGNAVNGLVWTGTTPQGLPSLGQNCLNWSDGSASQSGAYGDMSNGRFIGSGQASAGACNETKRLACISQYDVKRVSNVASLGVSGLNISMEFDYPADARVEIRRVKGAKSVSGSCTNPNDTVVRSIALSANGASDFAHVDSVSEAGRYSYRICLFDRFGGPAVSSYVLPSVAAAADQFNEIFVSSTSFRGNMDDAKGSTSSTPDERCSELATRANLSGSWAALISTTGTSAASKLAGESVPMHDVAANLIVSDSSQIWARGFANVISVNEFADNAVSGSSLPQVWTGTLANGSTDTPNTCLNWSSNSSAQQGAYGFAGHSGASWVYDSNLDQPGCDKFKRLYCVRK